MKKNMATPEKSFPNAQAPKLIEKIQEDLGWTQKELERVLRMTQQAVSNYKAGKVERERYNVIETLKNILAKKLPPPPPNTPEEVVDYVLSNDPQASSDESEGKKKLKKKGSRVIPPRRNARRKGGNQ